MVKGKVEFCCDKYDGTHDIVVQEKGKQYAKEICTHCRKFRKWHMNPNVTANVTKRNERINKILEEHKDKLTDADINFLDNIIKVRFPTSRQLMKLDRFYNL